MISNEDLERDIKLSGLKLKYIADYLGISYVSLRRKLNGQTSWKYEEMEKIRKLFGYKV